MGEMGRRGLDPGAQEFRPGNHVHPVRHVYFPVVLPDVPLSWCPTRSLLLSAVPSDVSESVVRRDLEAFGDVRALHMDPLRYGFLTVHFYDLRHAERAFRHIRNLETPPQFVARALIGGCVVWAEFAVPDTNNHATLLVFNLGPDVPASTLHQIFQRFGGVRELGEAPGKKQSRLIEFFDIRDAEKAVREMNGKRIEGKVVRVEFSPPDGVGRKLLQLNHPPTPRQQHHHCPFYPHLRADKLEAQTRDSPKRRMDSNNFISTTQSRTRRMIHTGGGFRRSHFLRKSDPCFLIASDCMDSRTTVMIKNIPNKYSLNLLLNTLDQHCMKCNEEEIRNHLVPSSSYDFVYLPIDFNNKCNVGYGFVNWTSPEGACRLYKAFNLQAWEVFNSRKICQVSYARLQGLEALKEHFRKSKFPREMKEHELPVVFCPPRDGIQLTEPLPVAGDGTGAHPSESTPAGKC